MPAVVPFALSDYQRAAEFLSAFPNEKRSPESWLFRFRAWWEENPSFTENFTRGWMLCESERILGFIGAIPMHIQVDGKKSLSIAGTTWRVLAEFRGMSMQLKSRKMAAYADAFHFAMTPAPQVAAILKLLRYRALEALQGTEKQSAILLNLRRYLRQKWKSNLAAALAPVASLAQSLALRRLWNKATDCVRELDYADARFDALWERTRARYRNTSIRTARMLNWYCFKNFPEDKKLIGCFHADRLIGYMILLVEKEPGMHIARCVDVWMDPSEDETATLGALVARAMQWALRGGLDRILFPHFHRDIAAHYHRLGIPQSAAWKRREFFYAPADTMKGMTPENSYFVGAQGDMGL